MRGTTTQVEGRVVVTVLKLWGDLDGSSYQDAIAEARRLYDQGARHMLLDLGDVPYMSSAGVIALQSMAMLLRGDEPPDPEMGWAAHHSLDRERERGFQQQFKLLNPSPRVDQVLEVIGIKSYLEVYTDLDAAVASFSA